MHRHTSYKVALGGIVSSLCLLAMFLTGVMPLLYLALPMAAGALLTVIVVEVGSGYAVLTYAATSILSLMLTFDKEAALIFILLFGHYPILREQLQKLRAGPLRLFLKLAVYNVCAIADYFGTVYLLGLDTLTEEFSSLGKYGLWIVLLFTNFIFLMYDYSLGGMTRLYRECFKQRLNKTS